MVLPSDDDLVVTINERDVRSTLTIDGQVGYPLASRDRVVISREKFRTRLVVFPGYSFFGILRNKLHWGVRKGKGDTV